MCSSFLPTLLDGQLCYKLKINEKSGEGEKNAHLLVVDYNEDRSIHISPEEDNPDRPSKTLLNYDSKYEKKQRESAKIHINTLSHFDGFGGGLYQMAAVKKMTSKNDFLAMDLKDKNCVTEATEDCRARKLLQKCDCVPWEIPGFQVGFFKIDLTIIWL